MQKYKPRNRYYISKRLYKCIRSTETNKIRQGRCFSLKRIQRILQIAQYKLRIWHRESTYRNRIGRTNHPINEEPDIDKSRGRYTST